MIKAKARKPLLLLLALTLLPTMQAAAATERGEGDDRIWVEVIVDKGKEMVIGDSAVVTFVVHSALPIAKIESKPIKNVKNATFRKVHFDRDATAGSYIFRGHVINTLVWAQIVVKPGKTGKVTIPECTYNAELYSVRRKDWFGNDIYGKKVKTKAKSAKTTIEVKEKPTRTTEEMDDCGGVM